MWNLWRCCWTSRRIARRMRAGWSELGKESQSCKMLSLWTGCQEQVETESKRLCSHIYDAECPLALRIIWRPEHRRVSKKLPGSKDEVVIRNSCIWWNRHCVLYDHTRNMRAKYAMTDIHASVSIVWHDIIGTYKSGDIHRSL